MVKNYLSKKNYCFLSINKKKLAGNIFMIIFVYDFVVSKL